METIDDREVMHDTWEEWHQEFSRAKKKMKKAGFKVRDVVIDVRHLDEFCRTKGLKNTTALRSKYVLSRR